MSVGSLRAVALDAPDIARLAVFYQELAGWRRIPDGEDPDEWITLDAGDGWRIGLQRALGLVPPRWPGQDRPQQGHLDLRVPDAGATADRARRLGATLLRRHRGWYTLADPAGHPFDLRAGGPARAVVLDCPDAAVLSRFYAQLVGPGRVWCQQVPGYTAPRWPDPAHPQQIHLDVTVADADVAERAVLAMGATRLDGAGPNWRVYADPAAKPFCLIGNG